MYRVDFFKRLFAGGGVIIAPKYAGATLPEEKKNIYLDSLYIAGFQYYQREETEVDLKENDSLTLKRQPGNLHDYFAVEVYHDDHKLGYLPRTDNRIIARIMGQGIELKAKIRSIDPESHPYRRVKIRVYSEMG